MRSFKLFILPLIATILFAQDLTTPKYEIYKETSLSSAAEVITLQQPSTGAKNVYPTDGSVYCSVDCIITFEKNGTAATTTALAVNSLQDNAPTPSATAFSASNVGTGTVINKLNITAGNTQPLDFVGMGLSDNNTAKNYTMRTNSISGTVRVVWRWIEK